ncbi:VOC family protein [Streptomyces sp. NBC_00120]|uniref:VOC family protein n=1 Tax=Streptomyces sp. NBC_00120 TaxID=2975660 RepID=UPI0022517203|nr:VOC family protein [Streptomyces sp. NBC_00120]MCX5323052.1 VOC family protein [Streptomyces sp. NBC_00120]
MLSTTYVPGAPNWLDLGVPDMDAAAAFYGGVFGWTFQSAGPEGGGYGFFQLDGKSVAAAGPLTEEGASPSWTVYFSTPDADGVAKAVEAAGGTVRVPPGDVFTAGRMAAFTDPAGAQFAVWQPADVQGLETVMQPNALCWTELYATDAGAAKDFYRQVFSWQYQDMPTGDGGPPYTVVAPAGSADVGEAGHGGIMQLQQENLDAGSGAEWHPYFGVEDCDATYAAATERGATTLFPPMHVPGVGRMAMVKDPFGATFALIKGDPTMG